MSKEIHRLSPEQTKNEVVFIIGPVGAGKSLISSELGKRNNLPVITTDIMRHCPKTFEEIKSKTKSISLDIEEFEKKLNSSNDVKLKEKLKLKLKDLFNEKWVFERQFEMRKLLPNLPNYEELGFNGDVSNFLRDKFGIVAWHFYQKQFENQMLKALCEQLNFACIVDMGGGMSISLDEEYAKLDKQFRQLNEKLYLKYIEQSKIGFKHIQQALKPYHHIVELELPKDYSMFERASKDELNKLFISSKQNKQLATETICVDGIIEKGKINHSVLSSICNQIENTICERDYTL